MERGREDKYFWTFLCPRLEKRQVQTFCRFAFTMKTFHSFRSSNFTNKTKQIIQFCTSSLCDLPGTDGDENDICQQCYKLLKACRYPCPFKKRLLIKSHFLQSKRFAKSNVARRRLLRSSYLAARIVSELRSI